MYAKQYSLLRADEVSIKKVKGIKYCVAKKWIRHANYKELNVVRGEADVARNEHSPKRGA